MPVIALIENASERHIAPAIPQTLLLSLCCLLLLIIILLVIWVIYLHRVYREPTEAEKSRAFHDQFDQFLSKHGVWTHKTKSGYFCPSCKARHFESQLVLHGSTAYCPINECHFGTSNPDHIAPPRPPKVLI